MSANASLLLTKRVLRPNRPFSGKDNHNAERFQHIARCQPPPGYDDAYRRWGDSVHRLPGTILEADFSVSGRMIVGIGAENVLENSITLNRLWGMPFIPGSALKGLARHYCEGEMRGRLDSQQMLDLFGSLEYSGALGWLDAWYVPDDGENPIKRDVLTPHHPRYNADPNVPPSDFDDPNPVPFVSAVGTYRVVLQAPDRDWAYVAMGILIRALDEWGIGAKTNPGYGRMAFEGYQQEWAIERRRQADEKAQAALEMARAQAEIEALAAQAVQRYQILLAALADSTLIPSQVAPDWAAQWGEIPESDIEERIRVGAMILERLKEDPGMYNWITGRVLVGSKHKPKKPLAYMGPLIAWMDEHDPGWWS